MKFYHIIFVLLHECFTKNIYVADVIVYYKPKILLQMATFKAVVQQHQQRRDGKFPISIRVTNNRKSCYIPTGLYCSLSQINRKTFEIKDQFIIARTNQTISEWERKMLTVDSATFSSMTSDEVKKFLTLTSAGIDYLAYCKRLVESNPLKWSKLSNCLLIFKDMGITKMMVTDFNSLFLRKFKDYLDNALIPITKNKVIVGHKHYAQNSKRAYLFVICQVFRMMQRDYNTEFNTVISHNPFIGLENYQHGLTAKRSMSAEQVRAFFNLQAKTNVQRMTMDLMKLSFCLCGINLIDIFALDKSSFDKKTMRITYERHKTRDRTLTHSLTSVHVEPEIYDIIEKYRASDDCDRLFAFNCKPDYASSRKIYSNLRALCERYDFDAITPYWFRHTWATIARNDCDISKDDIDLCLAHSGHNPMADVYIRPDWSRIDRANRKVLDFVFGPQQK